MKNFVNKPKTSNKRAARSRRLQGKIVVISSPSGGGKTTICNRLRQSNPSWLFSISCTTRDIRKGEKNGREYWFINRTEFMRRRKLHYFAEFARVHLHYYGTPRTPLEAAARGGHVILLDVDVKGAFSIKKKYPEALLIFIRPPSEKILRQRLKRRGTETQAQVALRLKNAIAEMKKYNRFDYVIVNDDLNKAVAAADHMIKSWTVGVTYFGRNKTTGYSVTHSARPNPG